MLLLGDVDLLVPFPLGFTDLLPLELELLALLLFVLLAFSLAIFS